MNRNKLISELKEIRDRIDTLIASAASGHDAEKFSDDALRGIVTDVNESLNAMESENPEKAGGSQGSGGLLDALDLSDSLRELYLFILKKGEVTADEIRQDTRFHDSDMLKIELRTLVRQGNIEKIVKDGSSKYRANAGRREGRKIDSEIWDALS